MTPKLCPMMFAETSDSREARSAEDPWMPYCAEDKCAWWDGRTNRCAATSIAHSVRELENDVDRIATGGE